MNVGVDVVFYGKVFRLCDADKFTKDFLESEGIAVNAAEPVAEDPYTQRRVESLKPKYTTTPSSFDKLGQFIEMDRKVLRFWAVWDDTVCIISGILCCYAGRPVVISEKERNRRTD